MSVAVKYYFSSNRQSHFTVLDLSFASADTFPSTIVEFVRVILMKSSTALWAFPKRQLFGQQMHSRRNTRTQTEWTPAFLHLLSTDKLMRC